MIRPLELADMPRIVELLLTRDDLNAKSARERAAIMAWIAFRNPYRKKDEATYFVVEDGGRIVAIHGRMPAMFSIQGKETPGYYVHDLYVHKEYREKGKGFWLTLELAKAIERESGSFFSLFGMTRLNLDIQRRRRYHEFSFDAFVKILRPSEALSYVLGNRALVRVLAPIASAALRVADLFQPASRSRGVEIEQVRSFDSRFDQLFKRVSPKLGICMVKSADYLNWKYGEGPFREDSVLAAWKDGELRGFVAVGRAPHRDLPAAVIKDFVADPEDKPIVHELLQAAIQKCRNEKMYSIRCVMSDERFASHLRRFLFFRLRNHEFVFLGNLEKRPDEAELLCDGRNWHVTLGESDIFMMSGGIPPEDAGVRATLEHRL
jgi:GNAT superfamily N-acetyltransferase